MAPSKEVACNLLETEKCPYCGESVKEENLGGHVERVHHKRSGSFEAGRKTVSYSTKTDSVFRTHRKRNIAILSSVLLAVIGIAFLASPAQNMNMPGTNPGPASPGSIEQFSYLNQQVSRCLWGANMGDETGYTNWINGLADDTYLQGACCNPMVTMDYQNQISELSNYTSLSSLIAKDPYNIPSQVAKADIAGEKLSLTSYQQSVLANAATLSKENWCCCQCWSWYQHEGLGKILIVNYGYTAQQVAHVVDLEACCGTGTGPMRMN